MKREPALSSAGFSLVELLTVVSVIGVLTMLATPWLGNYKSAATEAVARRNAQLIVTVFGGGKEAGDISWNTTSRNACIADVVAGRTAGPNNIFRGKVFAVPNVKTADLHDVYRFIGMDAENNLFYDKGGNQPAN